MGLSTQYARDDSERARFANVLSWAFGTDPESSRGWLARPGADHVRLGYDGKKLVGGLLEIPMGQWFGGRRVPMVGVAGVAVIPEQRGRGYALELMRQTLEDARAAGFALSALYPAAQTLYRRAGYELSGSHCRYEIRLADLAQQRNDELETRVVEGADDAAIEAVYQRVAKRSSGHLDRGPYVWARVRNPEGKAARSVIVESREGIEGYAILGPRPRKNSTEHDLALSDFITCTPGAALELLTYLARHRSTAKAAHWHGSPADARLLLLDTPPSTTVSYHFMLRLVDVHSALLARGYPPMSAELSLAVRDELLPANDGVYRLTVEDGQASVERSQEDGDAEMDVRALAALYSGFASATVLREVGLLQADWATLRRLDGLFAGPAPGLPDFF